MTVDAAQATELLAPLSSDALLWESFVFPFHPQTTLLTALLADGRIGQLKEVVSEFHFNVGQPGNIRLQPERGGGALYDVGCYPLRLARLLTDREPTAAHGSATVEGVDLDMAAVVDFDGAGRLLMSAGMARPASTFTRVVGTAGELRITNPFHPRPVDSVELWSQGEQLERWPAADGTAFRHAIDHIHQVMAGVTPARHLATLDALPQARAMDLVRAGAIHDPGQKGSTPQ
jgi:D-xylose 1-dehydrogenase (NADP+, D-xylono-1,5-lactone-forming)